MTMTLNEAADFESLRITPETSFPDSFSDYQRVASDTQPYPLTSYPSEEKSSYEAVSDEEIAREVTSNIQDERATLTAPKVLSSVSIVASHPLAQVLSSPMGAIDIMNLFKSTAQKAVETAKTAAGTAVQKVVASSAQNVLARPDVQAAAAEQAQAAAVSATAEKVQAAVEAVKSGKATKPALIVGGLIAALVAWKMLGKKK